MTNVPARWDEEADVVVVGYGFAGATAAITAADAGAKVLLLEKAPEQHKGGNSRVSANIVFWPADITQAEAHFVALAGPYLDNIPAAMIHVWAREMHANKAWLEGLGMVPVEMPYVEFPHLDGAECVRVLKNGDGPIGGERLWHMNNVSGPILAFKAPDIEVAQWLNLPHGKSFVFVAADGMRFTMEGEPCSVGDFHGKVNRHGVWMQQTLPTPIHMIFDETYRLSGPIGKATTDWDVVHGNRYNWSDDNLREVDKGWIKQADTVRALAQLIGISPDTLDDTLRRFNAAAAQAQDSDWGRTADSLAPLATPPYYAMEFTPALVNTQGGPRRNQDAQIIDVDGLPIGRLYSAGELGSIYSFLYQGGANIGECFAFGRIAGANAAKEIPAGD